MAPVDFSAQGAATAAASGAGALQRRRHGSPSAATVALQKEQQLRAEQTDAMIEAVLLAVKTGNDEPVLKLLEEQHVDVDTKDVEGRTPLIIASRDNQQKLTKLLLSHKANVNAKTKLGATALVAAATHGHTRTRLDRHPAPPSCDAPSHSCKRCAFSRSRRGRQAIARRQR